MERYLEKEDVVDLGAITEETHGSVVGFDDTLGGQQIEAGLSDD